MPNLEFYNSVNRKGLVDDVLFLCNTTTASYPITDIIRNINQAYHDVTRLIWECQDSWQYDDSNATDLPIATTTLVASQHDYAIPSTAQKVRRVEVLDSASNYNLLRSIDQRDVNVAISEFNETAGLPSYYDLLGGSVFLYPAPAAANCTLAAGLKIYFNRDITEFTTASTTDVPGFATPFHRLLSLGAAINYEADVDRLKLFLTQKSDLVAGLKKFYNSRNVEVRNEIAPAGKKNWKQYL